MAAIFITLWLNTLLLINMTLCVYFDMGCFNLGHVCFVLKLLL